jgi:hypothetical protein
MVVGLNGIDVEVMLNQANRHHGLKLYVVRVLASVLLFYVLSASMANVISGSEGEKDVE